MQHFSDYLWDQHGEAKVGASVLVTQGAAPGGPNALLYSDNGVTPKGNPLATGGDGSFDFFAANGKYTLSGPGFTRYIELFSIVDSFPNVASPVNASANEMNKLVGVTSNIQAQIDAKAIGASPTFSQLAAPTGAGIIYGVSVGVGSSARSVQDKAWERVDIKDFGAVGDGASHHLSTRYASLLAAQADYPFATALTQEIDFCALQTLLNLCSSDVQYGARNGYLPAGRYYIGADVPTIPKQFAVLCGDGQWSSQIIFTGTAGLSTVAMAYLRPILRDLAVVGNAGSGRGIDFSNISGQVYLGELKNLYIESGGNGLHAVNSTGSNFFSMVVDNVSAYSYTGHSFLAACGPGVSWRNCYALTAGTGKAGYRLTGLISMYSCNGVNSADYWGVFGSDTTAADGFQADFPMDDYCDVTMLGCNIEEWASGAGAATASAILLHNVYRNFVLEGGKIDRNNLATGYHSIIRSRIGPNAPGNPIILNPGYVFLGAGVPSGAYLYSDSQSHFMDKNGSLIAAGVTTWKEGGVSYPVLHQKMVHEVFGETSLYLSGLQTGRLSANLLRFETATLTVNSVTPDVTGKTVVLTANTLATTINTLAFQTGSGQDLGRNGFLIVQVEDANTTFKHNFAGVSGMKLKAGADYVASKGDCLQFVHSNFFNGTQAGWVQI